MEITEAEVRLALEQDPLFADADLYRIFAPCAAKILEKVSPAELDQILDYNLYRMCQRKMAYHMAFRDDLYSCPQLEGVTAQYYRSARHSSDLDGRIELGILTPDEAMLSAQVGLYDELKQLYLDCRLTLRELLLRQPGVLLYPPSWLNTHDDPPAP